MPDDTAERCRSEVQHIKELMEAHEQLDQLRHIEERRAVDLAAVDVNRRLAEMNQFREQLAEERGLYVTRSLHDVLEKTLGDKVDKLDKDLNGELDKLRNSMDDRLKALEIMRSNLEGKIWMMGAIITALLGGLQLIFKAYQH